MSCRQNLNLQILRVYLQRTVRCEPMGCEIFRQPTEKYRKFCSARSKRVYWGSSHRSETSFRSLDIEQCDRVDRSSYHPIRLRNSSYGARVLRRSGQRLLGNGGRSP